MELQQGLFGMLFVLIIIWAFDVPDEGGQIEEDDEE